MPLTRPATGWRRDGILGSVFVGLFMRLKAKAAFLPGRQTLCSMAIQLRASSSHASPVVLLPANGSITRSPGSVRKRIKKCGSWIGNRAGCGF